VIGTPMLRLMNNPVTGRAYLDSGVPLQRLATADEVAALIFLAIADASYLTTAAVPVDGGGTAIWKE
jgi:NAD(P)-dependent dehydrogenase (short-subunit alcohol dehydrogenase family)